MKVLCNVISYTCTGTFVPLNSSIFSANTKRALLGGESTGIGGYRWTARHARAPIPTNKCPKNPPSQENTIKMIIYQSKTHTATKCSQI